MKSGSITKTVRVRVDELRIHPTAQRQLSKARVKLLVEKMDLDAIGAISVVDTVISGERALWVVDGQHRVQALLDCGLGEWVVDAIVHVGKTSEADASRLFVELNTKLSVRPFDVFMNEVRAGFTVASGAAKIVEQAGIKIAVGGTSHNTLRCVQTIKKVFLLDSGETLAKALTVIVGAWGTHNSSFDGNVIEGIAGVLFAHKGKVNTPELTQRLAKYPGGASGLLGAGRGLMKVRREPVSACIGQCVLACYNASKRSRRLEAA